MTLRNDPRGRWRWEDEREREDQGLTSEGRFARHGGDPRWGTGGLRGGPPPFDPGPPPPDVRGPYAGLGPRGYRRSDDRIREDVCERLTENGEVDATDVDVSVAGGEVMLSGTVATRAQKRLAEDIASTPAGVIEVHNRLRVQGL